MVGDTYPLSAIDPVFINENRWTDDNIYQLTFNDQVRNILHNQLFIGAFQQMHYISKITMLLLDSSYNIIRNEDHDPMEFLGYEHPLGHFFDLVPLTLHFAYIRFLFHPRGNDRFDNNTVYLHSGNMTRPRPEVESRSNESLPIEDDEDVLATLNNDTAMIDTMINETLDTFEGSEELTNLDQCLAAGQQAQFQNVSTQQSTLNCSQNSSQSGFCK